MNPHAQSLNDTISKINPAVLGMLSELGKNLFMPKGILTQSAEAKTKATKYNATIGTATDKNGPMYLECMYEALSSFKPSELFPYAPATGVLELRKLWYEKMLIENPLLNGKQVSLPLVTNALTHGLSITAGLFVSKDDYVIMPDKFWGNYRLTFSTLSAGEIVTYNTFSADGSFNVQGLIDKAKECGRIKGKIIIMLNFPNNPTGYTPTTLEMNAIANGLVEVANSGVKIVAIADDAYFGLFHTPDCFTQSIFTLLAGRSDNLLAIKLDGATKEDFAWGFRVGFITFGATSSKDQCDMLNALETKVAGMIRGTISNGPHNSQSAVLKCLKHPEFMSQRHALNMIIKDRCMKVREVLLGGKYNDEFIAYPYNSGYFMCVKLTRVDAEKLRLHLLDNYQVGIVSTNATDIRIAFSSVEKDDIQDLFDIIYKGCKEL